jgi:hypothetical protein
MMNGGDRMSPSISEYSVLYKSSTSKHLSLQRIPISLQTQPTHLQTDRISHSNPLPKPRNNPGQWCEPQSNKPQSNKPQHRVPPPLAERSIEPWPSQREKGPQKRPQNRISSTGRSSMELKGIDQIRLDRHENRQSPAPPTRCQ